MSHYFSNQESVSAFSLGFAEGLLQGIYESGEGLFLFMTNSIKHPIHTSSQVIEAFTTLATLVRNDEWGMISETLSPEIHQLATQWDALPSEKVFRRAA